MYKNTVDIICIDSALEANAVRANLEFQATQVNMFFIGQAKHIVEVLELHHNTSKHVLICGHGSEDGFLMQELHSSIEKDQPFTKYMKAEDVLKHLHFSSSIVLSNACLTGNKHMAQAFLDKGASVYIGPTGYPEAAASLLYTHVFYYFLFCENYTIAEAHTKAKTQSSETEMFEMYTKG